MAPNAKPLAGNGFSPRAIYANRVAGVVTIVSVFGTDPETATQAQGSGFVVSPKGYILTNSHVITDAGSGSVAKPADKVYVEFQDRDRAEATIVGWDVFDDVGLIKVDPSAHSLVPVPLGNSAASRSVNRSPRSEARSATRTRSGSASSRRRTARSTR